MADLIDRQATIDVVREVMLDFIEYEDEIEVPMGETDKQLLSIKKAISKRIKALPSAQQWIPCGADFPKKDGDYLVTTHNGQLARYIFNKGNSEEYWTRCVTAWMPLPEPYKGE